MLTISTKTQKLLLKEYHKKHRHYHTYSHICHVLDTLHDHKDRLGNFQAAEFAANFHDIVYEVGDDYKYNEQRSCLKFLQMIEEDNPGLKYNPDDPDFKTLNLALVMIGCTHGHTLDRIRDPGRLSDSDLEDVKMFLDADIKILSESQDKVMRFEQEIRKEFSIYGDEAYRVGRTQVLRSFLERPRIYMSEIGRPWEDKARSNLQFLIDSLQYQKSQEK